MRHAEECGSRTSALIISIATLCLTVPASAAFSSAPVTWGVGDVGQRAGDLVAQGSSDGVAAARRLRTPASATSASSRTVTGAMGGPLAGVRSPSEGTTTSGVGMLSGATPPCVELAAASMRCPRWTWTSDSSASSIYLSGVPSEVSLAASPAGDVVYSTKATPDAHNSLEYNTFAVQQTTGVRIWSVLGVQAGDQKLQGSPAAIAVDPKGRYVVVTGGMSSPGSAMQFGTVAYDARTGRQLWYMLSPIGPDGGAVDVRVTSDGRTVYVDGMLQGINYTSWIAVKAYNALSGDEVWSAQYTSPQSNDVRTYGPLMTLGPDFVAVGGWDAVADATGQFLYNEPMVVAFDGRDGSVRWIWHGPHSATTACLPINNCNGGGATDAVDISADGSRVYVVGSFDQGAMGMVTAALSAHSGGEIWSHVSDSVSDSMDISTPCACYVVASRSDNRVYVANKNTGATGGGGSTYTAYNGTDGTALWSVTTLPGTWPTGTAVGADGRALYLTTQESGTLGAGVVSVDTGTGATLWTSHYRPACNVGTTLRAIAVASKGQQVDVAGYIQCLADDAPGNVQYPEVIAAYDAT